MLKENAAITKELDAAPYAEGDTQRYTLRDQFPRMVSPDYWEFGRHGPRSRSSARQLAAKC
jgi:hypothetical protein